MRKDAAAKREDIERKEREAEMLRSMPVDDSKIVEQMFGFLPEGEHEQVGDECKLKHLERTCVTILSIQSLHCSHGYNVAAVRMVSFNPW